MRTKGSRYVLSVRGTTIERETVGSGQKRTKKRNIAHKTKILSLLYSDFFSLFIHAKIFMKCHSLRLRINRFL